MARKEDRLHGVDTSKKVDIREYKQMVQGRFGKDSVNEKMLNVMDKAVGGKKATVKHFNHLNAKLKIGNPNER